MNKFFERLDKRYTKICLYASVTVLLTLAAAMVLWTASPVVATIWDLFCAVVVPIVYGAAFSYLLNPLVTRVSRALAKRGRFAADESGQKRRIAAVLISLLIVFLAILGIVAMFTVMVTHSMATLRWDKIQEFVGSAQGDFVDMLEGAQARLEEWGLMSSGSNVNLLNALGGVKDVATTLVFAVIFSVYFLIDGPHVAAYLSRVFRALLGKHAVDPTRFLADADRVFSGYFRGQGIDALIVGLMSGILLTIVGVPYAPVVGVLAGLGNLIPYVGGPVGFASVALMCLPDAAWTKMIAGFIVMGVVMFVDGNIINPLLLSDNVEVHPILVLAALIAGGAVGGIAGMLVAVPLAAFFKIQLDRWVDKHYKPEDFPDEDEPALEAPADEE